MSALLGLLGGVPSLVSAWWADDGDVGAPPPPAPTLTSFTPASGPIGTVVTFTGTNLSGATVTFNGGAVATLTSNTATQIVCPVPAGATTGTVTVATAGGSVTTSFTVTVPVAGGIPLAWALSAFPAGPVNLSTGAITGGRSEPVRLQLNAPNSLVVSRITNPELQQPVTPTSVAWRLLEGTTQRAAGTFALSAEAWRAVVNASDVPASWSNARLEITVTPASGAPTPRRYLIAFQED